MRETGKLRRSVGIALSVVLAFCLTGLPAHAARIAATAEQDVADFTVTVYTEGQESYAGVEMSVVLSDGLTYISRETDPAFTALYQFNGTRHLIGGMTTEGKNAFSGKQQVVVLHLGYEGSGDETISIAPSISRYDAGGKPVAAGLDEQTIRISRPGADSDPAAGGSPAEAGDTAVTLDAQHRNVDVFLDGDAQASAFTDIKGHWAERYIVSLASQHYVSGVGGGLYKPNDKLTRAEFVQMFYNVFGGDRLPDGPLPFKDTAAGGWYVDAVAWASGEGIVTGYDDISFGPNDPIKRQDMAVIMLRLASAYGIALPTEQARSAFADDSAIGDYAKDAVYRLQTASVIAGKGGGLFDPLGHATRAEAAKIMYLILEPAGKIDPAYAITP